jgi:hypothetical protein
METRKTPRSSTAARKTTRKKSEEINSQVPVTPEPVSIAEPSAGTQRKAVMQGHSTIDADEVRRRAYELYQERGQSGGSSADDWFRAEQEIRDRKRSA